jgi:glycosyltransferase involved in cell wall biosynthesis
VGILGRLDPVKGHSVFLEAAAYLIKKYPEAQFLIAGKEANIRSEVLINQMMALGLENQVKLLGFQPDAKEFMRKCSIGVIASVGSEEISRACLEWMSVGRPVVGTLVGCLPELIEPEETGSLVPAGDAYEMAQAMVRYADSRDLIKEHGAKAAHFIAEKFSPDIILNKTLSLYQKILMENR